MGKCVYANPSWLVTETPFTRREKTLKGVAAVPATVTLDCVLIFGEVTAITGRS